MQADGPLGALCRSIFIWNLFTGQKEVACNPLVPPSEPTQEGKGLVGEVISLTKCWRCFYNSWVLYAGQSNKNLCVIWCLFQ